MQTRRATRAPATPSAAPQEIPARRVPRPTVAEIVAASLRDRILSGEIAEMLPKQEDLVAEFHVSPPSIREALRILQTEGVATVLRGNVGGARVHVPGPANIAYTLGMILQSEHVNLDDVFEAMRLVEPACAAESASRRDRMSAVVPRLDRIVDRSDRVIDDPYRFMTLSRQFHEELVGTCGNRTLAVMLGALEFMYSAHVKAAAKRSAREGVFEDIETRRVMLGEHRDIAAAIRAGDSVAARHRTRDHLAVDARRGTGIIGHRRPVDASLLRAI